MKDDRLIYVVVMDGFENDASKAFALGRSLRLLGDTIPRAVVTNQRELPWSEVFHQVVPHDERALLGALERTSANRALVLSPSMLAFKRLDDIFAWCQGKTLCAPDSMETGLIYYERPFDQDRFREATRTRSGAFLDALRAHPEAWTPIPDSLQFQSGLTGNVSELEMDITRARCRAVVDGRYTEPYLFRAGDSRHVSRYREQVRTMERLAAYERTHGRGYHSPALKFRRSIERRILRATLGFKV